MRFLVAWGDRRSGTDNDIYGQLVDADGVITGTASSVNFPISLAASNQTNPSVAYDSVKHSFLTAYGTLETGRPDIGFGLVVPPRKVKVLSPSGHTWASGPAEIIHWGAPVTAVTFKVKCSLDGGGTWQQINCRQCHAAGQPPISNQSNGSHRWSVPVPAGNLKNCLIRVEGYDSKSRLLSADRSRAPFTIEVVKLTAPYGGQTLTSNASFEVTWTTNQTVRDVHSVNILYTIDGGATWKPAGKVDANPGTYQWTAPHVAVAKTKCNVKVVLKDQHGVPVGSDTGSAFFAIQP